MQIAVVMQDTVLPLEMLQVQFQKRLPPSSQQTLPEGQKAPALDHTNLLTRHHHHRHLGGNYDGKYFTKQ